MSVTWAEVALLEPAAASVPADRQAAIIADCYELLQGTRWGARLDQAVKYLAAHTAVMPRGGAAGAVTSRSLGDAAVSYASPSMAMEHLALTSWGMRFRDLAYTLGPFAVVA